MARPPCTSRAGDSKKRWPNRDAAVFVAHKVASTTPHSQAVYHCDDCDGWHLSTHRKKGNHLQADVVVHGHENLFDLLPNLVKSGT